MIQKLIFHGGLFSCCLETLKGYDGPEHVGTKIGCKFHKDPNEPVMIVTTRGWEWIGGQEHVGAPQGATGWCDAPDCWCAYAKMNQPPKIILALYTLPVILQCCLD